MAVNLCAAHEKTESCAVHEVLLTRFLLSCSTLSMDRVQHIKYGSRAAH